MMKTVTTVFLSLCLSVVLAACGEIETSIAEVEYKQALGLAVCEVINDFNSRGILSDEEAFREEFDPAIQKAILGMGYETDDWLAAKAKYFSDEEEHTKLIKLHITWCLIGGSISNPE